MLYRIAFICDEVEDFVREITLDTESTFLDLNKAILASCEYPDDQMTSFFLCDEDWTQREEITRQDVGKKSPYEDTYLMESTRLSEFIDSERQRLVFVFDPFGDRVFYLEVKEIITGKTQKEPACTQSAGKAPKQILDIDLSDTLTPGKGSAPLEDFGEDWDENGYNADELDPDGFQEDEAFGRDEY